MGEQAKVSVVELLTSVGGLLDIAKDQSYGGPLWVASQVDIAATVPVLLTLIAEHRARLDELEDDNDKAFNTIAEMAPFLPHHLRAALADGGWIDRADVPTNAVLASVAVASNLSHPEHDFGDEDELEDQ